MAIGDHSQQTCKYQNTSRLSYVIMFIGRHHSIQIVLVNCKNINTQVRTCTRASVDVFTMHQSFSTAIARWILIAICSKIANFFIHIKHWTDFSFEKCNINQFVKKLSATHNNVINFIICKVFFVVFYLSIFFCSATFKNKLMNNQGKWNKAPIHVLIKWRQSIKLSAVRTSATTYR